MSVVVQAVCHSLDIKFAIRWSQTQKHSERGSANSRRETSVNETLKNQSRQNTKPVSSPKHETSLADEIGVGTKPNRFLPKHEMDLTETRNRFLRNTKSVLLKHETNFVKT